MRRRPLPSSEDQPSPLSIFGIFLRLGCTSFGGPTAHLGYFRHEFVVKRRWLDENAYADLVALCNFLPGPASSQVGIALGSLRSGLTGGIAAWLGFTAPSALAMLFFAQGLATLGYSSAAGWIQGLIVAAVAVVAQAVWGLGKAQCPDRLRVSLALATAVAVSLWHSAWSQIIAIAFCAAVGWRCLPPVALHAPQSARFGISRTAGIAAWSLFAALLLALPLLAHLTAHQALAMFSGFYRSGSLVFGGGHVVLPLLHNEVVLPGWIDDDTFLAGYGAAQAVPGPLFSFAAYLGSALKPAPNGLLGGVLGLIAIFLPAFLLVVGALPFWAELREKAWAQSALRGAGAAVVGLLLAALYDPIWTSAIHTAGDLALAALCFWLLHARKWPPLAVVVLAAATRAAIAPF